MKNKKEKDNSREETLKEINKFKEENKFIDFNDFEKKHKELVEVWVKNFFAHFGISLIEELIKKSGEKNSKFNLDDIKKERKKIEENRNHLLKYTKEIRNIILEAIGKEVKRKNENVLSERKIKENEKWFEKTLELAFKYIEYIEEETRKKTKDKLEEKINKNHKVV